MSDDPHTLILDSERYELSGLDADLPGVGYARVAEGGGVRLAIRVHLIRCPGCGAPVKRVEEAGRRTWRCGTPACRRVWHLSIVREPGGADVLALVQFTI